MVDPLSPIDGKLVAGHHGAGGDADVTLGARTIPGLWQCAGWAGFEAAMAPVLGALELDSIGDYRQTQRNVGAAAWRIAPDRVLIETAQDLAEFGSADLAVLDLGHARTVITLHGRAARDLLAHVVSVDIAEEAFPPGEFRQTGLHGVGILMECRDDDSFDVLVPGTWAETVWDMLFDTAQPYGIEIGGAACRMTPR